MAHSGSLQGFLDAAAYQFQVNRPLFPMYALLLVSAVFPIYTGAHASLSRPSSAAKPVKRTSDIENEDEDDDTIQKMEGMTPKDALLFPFTAGCVLAGLYYAIKTYGADMINVILGAYFSFVGTFSVAKLINDTWATIQSFVFPTYYVDNGKLWRTISKERKVVSLDKEGNIVATRTSPLGGFLARLPLPGPVVSLTWSLRDLTKRKFLVEGYAKDLLDFKALLTQHNVLSTMFGVVAVAYSLLVDKPWWLTNLQGFAVSYGALQILSPTTFGTGTLILAGLFFYDIWAVFFTPLMVTVAKNLDVPIKLVFPRPDEPSATPGAPPVRNYSMLGLGDIVLPGLMIGLALRFDLYMHYLRQQKKAISNDQKASEEKIPFVPVGHWGDKMWTASKTASPLPTHLTSRFSKTYFHTSLVGYLIGMLLTLVFMSVYQHAQPALLYLVPCVLISVWGTGLVKGELKQMWEYTEALDGKAIDESSNDSDKPSEESLKSEGAQKGVFATIYDSMWGSEKSTSTAPCDNISSKRESSKEKTNADEDQRQGIVFSFTISEPGQEAKGSEDESAAKPTAREASTVEPDDTVLVTSDDLCGSNSPNNGSEEDLGNQDVPNSSIESRDGQLRGLTTGVRSNIQGA